MNSFGADLRLLRTRARLTQAELADAIQIDQSTVSAIELGRRETTTEVLQRWISACKGRILISPAGADPIADLPAELRGDARDLLRLWAKAPRRLQESLLGTLRATVPEGDVE